ncbi:pectinesterase family protein [Cellvibrio fontiphilus]|uniref:Pectinesterase family protein n=1 Tax=Cellvibrio fontiphilus TaxID=1815559 RepID=A0ABV7FA34_9GAMM
MRLITIVSATLALLLSACELKQDTPGKDKPAAATLRQYDAIVDANTPGAYSSIQAALADAPENTAVRYRVLIKAGQYKEKVTITRPNLEIRGEGAAKTIIYFDAYAGNSRGYRADGWGTPGSATMSINSTDVHLAELTIENTFDYLTNDAKGDDDPTKAGDSQAVALLLDTGSDRVSLSKVTLNGYQDTLFVHGKRAYFYQSAISGNVDFIFGQGNAVFDQSTIISRPRNSSFNAGEIQSFITAPSTNIQREFGLTFLDCKLTYEAGVPEHSITLGRPWHPTTTFPDGRYADPNAIGKAVFIRTFMDKHIHPQGWSSMAGTAPDGTKSRIFTPEESRFFEYQSSGPGATINEQRPQLTDAQAAGYSLEKIFIDWQPAR